MQVLDSIHNHLDERFRSLETEAKACGKILAVKDWPSEADQLPQFGNEAIDVLIANFRPFLLRNRCDLEVARCQKWPALKVYVKRIGQPFSLMSD